jgi:Protein of unknown function (DUF2752)
MALTDQPAPVAGAGPPAVDWSIAPNRPSRLTRWLCASGAVGICASGLGFVYLVDPNSATNPYPRCLLKAATGIDCPGCGGTRALYSLLHGDVAGAADHNIIVFLVSPLVLYLAVRFALDQFGVRLPALRARPWMGWAAIVFLVVFSVVRNLPFAPFHYLNSAA